MIKEIKGDVFHHIGLDVRTKLFVFKRHCDNYNTKNLPFDKSIKNKIYRTSLIK